MTTLTRGARSATHNVAGAAQHEAPRQRPRALPAPRPAHTAVGQLHAARAGLAEAAEATTPAVRYVSAHLAALRAAAAVLAAHQPLDLTRRRARPRSVWVLLPEADPALREWAAYFAAGADKRAAAEAGLPRAVTPREADELLHDAEIFVTLVEDTLGVPIQQSLPTTNTNRAS
ncbi:SAV_6107 family HEPN domain-containing protein [Actinomadura oligospora]|uniref:SAV_6107 family HEPN domain-containing protein n=1 Tax=Actinomadura oligospora TaxID=111804 RepID=UPI0004B83CDE|nr:SAV_6107 family HEPN domain-containing protein [Actinomadura oligospora]